MLTVHGANPLRVPFSNVKACNPLQTLYAFHLVVLRPAIHCKPFIHPFSNVKACNPLQTLYAFHSVMLRPAYSTWSKPFTHPIQSCEGLQSTANPLCIPFSSVKACNPLLILSQVPRYTEVLMRHWLTSQTPACGLANYAMDMITALFIITVCCPLLARWTRN